jgi:hypothetical protein
MDLWYPKYNLKSTISRVRLTAMLSLLRLRLFY